MTEDFNEGPVVIEDKQCIFMDKENCCLCGNKTGLLECGNCGLRFCNLMQDNQSHIIYHLQDSNHNSIKIITDLKYPNKFEELKCAKCCVNDVFSLFILIKENNIIDINQIFCKDHCPKKSNIQPIIEKEKKEEKTNDSLIISKDKNEKACIKNVNKKHIIERQKILKEFDDIVVRKLNKVKLKYDNKYDYYQIYKPLIEIIS